jgi:hypothetical protein
MDDRHLTALLQEAVSDVEPSDRLAEIRAAVSPRPRRFGWYAAGGTVLAVAASVAVAAIVLNPSADKADDTTGPVLSPTVDQPTPTPTAHLVAAYYIGDTPVGPRLYREFHVDTGIADPSEGIDALMAGPDDPDYRSAWPVGSLARADYAYEDGAVPTRIDVTLADAGLLDRPSGMSEAEARLAVEQVIFTVQARAGRRLPVQFRYGRNPIDQVLGVPTSEPLANSAPLDVLSLMSISDPVEGLVVSDSFTANGAASAFEGQIDWQVTTLDSETVLNGYATAGMDPGHLVEWTTEPIDISGLEPGTYLFVASTSDPSNGEGVGVFTDTRTIVVE